MGQWHAIENERREVGTNESLRSKEVHTLDWTFHVTDRSRCHFDGIRAPSGFSVLSASDLVFQVVSGKRVLAADLKPNGPSRVTAHCSEGQFS
jgi:hypothetical protein